MNVVKHLHLLNLNLRWFCCQSPDLGGVSLNFLLMFYGITVGVLVVSLMNVSFNKKEMAKNGSWNTENK